MPPELVAELDQAINARVLEMDHYVHPDGQMQSRHKGDHLHLCGPRRLLHELRIQLCTCSKLHVLKFGFTPQ